MIRLILCVFMVSLLGACASKKGDDRMGTGEYTMEQGVNKVLVTDEETTSDPNYHQMFYEGDSLRLAIYNSPRSNICIFDVASGREIDKIPVYKEGPNGVQADPTGFFVKNRDEVYLYAHWGSIITQINHEGEIQEQIDMTKVLIPHRNQIPPQVYPMSHSPMRLIGDNFIFGGTVTSEDSVADPVVNSMIVYNRKTQKADYLIPFPESIYGNHRTLLEYWSVFLNGSSSYAVNEDEQLVVNLSACDSIYVYDLRTHETKRYFAGYHESNIKPEKRDINNPESDLRYFYEHTNYGCIYYDRYNKLYYREVGLPVEFESNSKKQQYKDFAFVILDEQFNKVGEFDFPKGLKIRFASYIISPEGVHLRIPTREANSDNMEYLTYKPKKIK